MSAEAAHGLFNLAMFLLNGAGVCMLAHVMLSIALRVTMRNDSGRADAFSFSTFGSLLTRRPWLLDAKYFLPWIPAPNEITSRGRFAYLLFSAARVAGAGVAITFIGFFGTMIYMGIRNAQGA